MRSRSRPGSISNLQHHDDTNDVNGVGPKETSRPNGTNGHIHEDRSSLQPGIHQSDGDGPDIHESGRPFKRRRTVDTLAIASSPEQRSPSKPISPPWKKIVVEGPTSFVEGGRRKSSRTNAIPLELQPPSEKRQTRSKLQTKTPPIATRSRHGGASTGTALTPTSSQRPGKVVPGPKRPQSAGKGTTHATTPRSAKNGTSSTFSSRQATSIKPSPRKLVTPTKSRPLRGETRSRRSTNAPATDPSPTNPHQTRRAARVAEHAAVKAKRKADGHISGWSSDEAEVLDPSIKTPKLKFKVRLPKVPVPGSNNIPKPRQFSSFREWFSHEDVLNEEDVRRMTDDEARREALMRTRILDATHPGGVLSEGKCSVYVPEKQPEPSRRYFHQDHLVSQAVFFRELMFKERSRHHQTAKRIAHAAKAEWKRRQPKTDEEILQEQQEVIRRTYKQLHKDLQVKWDVVTAEVNRRRLVKYEEEQELLGKQALNEMLQQSTKLLDARRARRSSELATDEESTGENLEDSDDGAETSVDGDDGDDDDESNMSSSDIEGDEAVEEEGHDDDEGLTIEQLRRKYSLVPTEDGDEPQTEDDLLDESTAEKELAAIEDHVDGDVHDAMDIDANELEVYNQLTPDDSDESVDMDDDMGTSDEGDDSDESSADELAGSDEEEEDGGGLLGFFNKKELATEVATDTPMSDGDGDEMEVVRVEPESSRGLKDIATLQPAHSTDPSTQTSPATNATTKPSEADSTSSVELQATSGRPSSTTTPQPSHELRTPIPFLLRGTLREYQHYGLDWLAGLYANGTNGILADEMGLGKTIQTIALLAHLAVEHEVWGPHLIVVPTSVMLNWEMEFKKWCPGFKILTYYGTQEERKQKRKGWLDDNLWHVCITSYQLVLQDQQTFKRRNWHYMVLDEAHNIKNFRSQRWQTLLTFKTRARLLLTGTPLQNNLTELWSLLFFLMPTDSTERGIGGFADLKEFSDWFRKPVEQILEHGRDTMDDEAKTIVSKLHKVLRPYLLRRLKADVEKQMPGKYEHVVYCRLSKRQRYLYDGFMALSQTRETLASGNYLSIINCLMQLRKVCNHPDLFETRQIVTSFAMPRAAVSDFEVKEQVVRRKLLREDPMARVNVGFLNLVPAESEHVSHLTARESSRIIAIRPLQDLCKRQLARINWRLEFDASTTQAALNQLENTARISRLEELRHCVYLNALRSQNRPIYGSGLTELLTVHAEHSAFRPPPRKKSLLSEWYLDTSETIRSMVLSVAERSQQMESTVDKFACLTPAVVAPEVVPLTITKRGISTIQEIQETCREDSFHAARVRLSIAFPDKRLLQYDCGKLQRLDKLLRDLQTGGHRALIFTQMTKVLDILEQFLNIHGHRYLRLDGATKVEQRQILTDRFNNDNRILAFILSSRSGGLGINLTGADTVIFYDLDWNPAMDKQCQDRCHRIGQTRDVHIYRFVSEYTIESNILRKSNQKRMLDDVVIQEGEFTTDYFNKLSIRDMLGDDATSSLDGDASANAAMDRVLGGGAGKGGVGRVLEQVEDREDIVAAKVAEKEIVEDEADFEEKAATPKVTTPAVGTPKSGDLAMPPPPASLVKTQPGTPKEVTLEVEESGLAHHDDAAAAAAAADADEVVVEEEDDEPGHVDEYMLRFKEWDLRDAPVIVPVAKDRNKKGTKKGQGKGGPKKASGGAGAGATNRKSIGRIT